MVVVDARFPHLLRDLRHDRGLSLRELATRVHYSHSYLWDIETGRKQPTPDIAQTLDDALEADGMLAELVTESPAIEPVDHVPIAAAMHLLDTNRHHIEDIARQGWSAADPGSRAAAAHWAQFASWLYAAFVRNRPPLTRWGASRYSRSARQETGASPFRLEVSRQGRTPRTECRSVSRQPAPPEVASRLMIAAGDSVIRRVNTYYADGEPVQMGVTYIPVGVAGTSTAVTTKALGRGSLYSRFADLGHQVARVREHVISRLPTPDEAANLRIPAGVPVLDILHTSYDDQGQPFEVTRFTIRADLTVLDYEMPVED
jgi:GntR family transcriptional regulator